MLIERMRLTTLKISVSLIIASAGAVSAQVSPLQTIVDGREEAANSRLTEAGVREMSQQGVNIILYICGAAGIILTAIGIQQLWTAARVDTGNPGTNNYNKRGILMIVFGGLLTISAVVAAIVPNAVLGTAVEAAE